MLIELKLITHIYNDTTHLSLLSVAKYIPQGSQHTPWQGCLASLNIFNLRPLCTSHTMTVSSNEQLSILVESQDQHRSYTSSKCPLKWEQGNIISCTLHIVTLSLHYIYDRMQDHAHLPHIIKFSVSVLSPTRAWYTIWKFRTI